MRLLLQLLGGIAGASIATIFSDDPSGGFNHVADGILVSGVT